MGAIGDVRMDNGRIVAIITRADRAVGFAVSGGNIIDLARAPDGEDHLNQLTLYLNDQFPRQALYDKLKIVAKGGRKKAAIVRASGVDTKDRRIAIVTEYELRPDEDWLTIRTHFTATATATIRNYKPGDAIQWGRSEHMAPGPGFELPGRRVRTAWIAGLGRRTSYAWVPADVTDSLVMHGSMWSDPIGDPIDLVPNEKVTYVRHVVVGTGDTASMSGAIARLRKEATGRVTGRVSHGESPITDAVIHITDGSGALQGLARTNADGWYAIELPAGRYQLKATAPGRPDAVADAAEATFAVAEGNTVSRSFRLEQRASLSWRIDSGEAIAQPVKVTVIGVDGTPNPMFGPSYAAEGAHHVVLSPRGFGEVPVGVGTYRVLVSRGNEYEVIDHTVQVKEGGRAHVAGRMVRSVDTPGLISAELHQHAAPSFDSGVAVSDRALSNAVEGVEVMVSTDHNVIVDYRPAVAAAGLGRSVTSIVGTEATTHSVGHFNAFPMTIDRADPRGGMVDPEGMSPAEIFAFVRTRAEPTIAPFIQTNHPRAGFIGYFDLMKFDPKTARAEDPRFSEDLDGMEVISFGFEKETAQTLQDWFALLRRGVFLTATGTSDSHTIYGRENGWPRTLVCVDDDVPYRLDMPAFIAALKRGCATVSAGPIARIHSGDVQMGGVVRAENGAAEITIDVKAASWIPTERLQIFVDGRLAETRPLTSDGVQRYDQTYTVKCKSDCFVAVLVDAERTLAPIVSTWRGRNPKPIALTNPIFIDVDGDGKYKGTVQ